MATATFGLGAPAPARGKASPKANCRQAGALPYLRRLPRHKAKVLFVSTQSPASSPTTGVAEHLRQLQRERWHADHVYRAEQLGRTAAWKASHPEAKPQERRRAHLRMLIAKYTAAVSIDVVVRDFTYLITHAAELKAALGISEAVSFEAAKQRTIATVRASRAQGERSAARSNGHAAPADALTQLTASIRC